MRCELFLLLLFPPFFLLGCGMENWESENDGQKEKEGVGEVVEENGRKGESEGGRETEKEKRGCWAENTLRDDDSY